jgi:hypothetical protein
MGVLAISAFSARSDAQVVVAATAREAALAWVLDRGVLPIPRTDVAIVRDPYFKKRPSDVPGTPPPAVRTREVEVREANVLAAIVGPEARSANGDDVLVCLNYDCATRTTTSVVTVNDPLPLKEGGTSVNVQLYSPGANRSERVLYVAVVEVERRGAGWAGVGTLLASDAPRRVRVPIDSLGRR